MIKANVLWPTQVPSRPEICFSFYVGWVILAMYVSSGGSPTPPPVLHSWRGPMVLRAAAPHALCLLYAEVPRAVSDRAGRRPRRRAMQLHWISHIQGPHAGHGESREVMLCTQWLWKPAGDLQSTWAVCTLSPASQVSGRERLWRLAGLYSHWDGYAPSPPPPLSGKKDLVHDAKCPANHIPTPLPLLEEGGIWCH